MELEQIVNLLVEKIKTLPDGTRTYLYDLIPNSFDLTTEELFAIHNELVNIIKLENIELDYSEFKDQIIGLPFNIPFVVKIKKTK